MKNFEELLKESLIINIANKDAILSNILKELEEEESLDWIKRDLPILLLLLLNRSDNYGNGLIKELKIIAKERLNDKEGTIYPSLHRLELQGFLSSYFVLDNSIEKKYYHITKNGKAYLKEKEKIITHIKNDKKILNKENFICL